ncbi:MAG: hypothetical protein WAN25_04100, partial [Candidatus Acidiferrum sp.]
PEESTRTGSEALIVVTIVFFPFNALCSPAQILYGPGRMKMDDSVQNIDVELLPWFELQVFPDFLGDNNLKLG